MRMERERERETEREREREERERGAREESVQAQQQRQDAGRPGWAREAGEDGTAPWGVSRNRKRAGLLTTSTSADVYSEAEPLDGFFIGAL